MTERTMDATRGIASIHPTRGVGWRRRWWAPAFVALACVAAPAAAQIPDAAQVPASGQATAADSAAVRRAALDYLEGFYEGDDDKLRRSIHPDMDKFGYARPDPSAEYRRMPWSYDQMLEFAASVRAGRNLPPEGAPKEVILLDVQDQTAAVKVLAWWGQDYMHLARIDGRWMIVHVLWQSLDG